MDIKVISNRLKLAQGSLAMLEKQINESLRELTLESASDKVSNNRLSENETECLYDEYSIQES